MKLIQSRAELEALPPGTLLVDRDGQPMTRTPEGEFALFSLRELRWVYYAATEIDGSLHDGPSEFFPIEVAG